jgi:hypothetical protein
VFDQRRVLPDGSNVPEVCHQKIGDVLDRLRALEAENKALWANLPSSVERRLRHQLGEGGPVSLTDLPKDPADA